LLFLIAIFNLLGCSIADRAATIDGNYRVVERVIDGDTLVMSGIGQVPFAVKRFTVLKACPLQEPTTGVTVARTCINRSDYIWLKRKMRITYDH
jgi:endonuclease YncB( thermonuclease family)